MCLDALSTMWDLYLEVFRVHAHQLLAWAHEDVRSRIDAGLDEPAITGLLADAMKARLNFHPDTPAEYVHYWVGDQEPISPDGQLGNDRLRLDVTVIRTGDKPRLSYIFEAKRLRAGSFTIGKYTGASGMGDFLECRYGTQCPEAAMVGLVQDRDAIYWSDELKRVFAADQAGQPPLLAVKKTLSPLLVIAAIPDEWESHHVRSNGTDLRLLHIFLSCI